MAFYDERLLTPTKTEQYVNHIFKGMNLEFGTPIVSVCISYQTFFCKLVHTKKIYCLRTILDLKPQSSKCGGK